MGEVCEQDVRVNGVYKEPSIERDASAREAREKDVFMSEVCQKKPLKEEPSEKNLLEKEPSKKKALLITGASGYLGSLIAAQNKENFNIIALAHKDLDFSQPELLAPALDKLEFDLCLHCVAQTSTEYCAAHPELSDKINRQAAIEVAKACQRRGARLIFPSSEQCFSGKKSGAPFSEEDSLEANTLYGEQKIAVDRYLQESDCDFVTLRLSWLMDYARPGLRLSPNIYQFVREALCAQEPRSFSYFEHRCLSWGENIARQFMQISRLERGVYHFASANEFSTFEAARFIARALGASSRDCDRLILPNKEKYREHPKDVRLICKKIQAQGMYISSFTEDIASMVARDKGLSASSC